MDAGSEEERDILDPDISTMRSTTVVMMTTTPSEDTQAVDDGNNPLTVSRDEEIVPGDKGEGSGESVEFGKQDDNPTTLFEESSEFAGEFGGDDPRIVFQEEKIVPADEEGSQFEDFSSGTNAREPKSAYVREEFEEKPSSASLLSSLLSSLYEEETQRKAEKSKSEDYVFVNHISGSKQIYI